MRDAVEAALDARADDVARVAGGRVGEEVPRPVLEALVVRQEQRRAVAEAVLVQDAVQPGLLARAQSTLFKS